MITQETKPVKTWERFNLAILKVNLNSLSWKNRSSYNKTYKPHARLLIATHQQKLLTRLCASSESTDSFFLGFSTKYKHTACISLSFNGSNWNDHQGVENFFSLKTLSLCERKLVKDLTRDSHKPQYEQH